jgi:hypothetical protein
VNQWSRATSEAAVTTKPHRALSCLLSATLLPLLLLPAPVSAEALLPRLPSGSLSIAWNWEPTLGAADIRVAPLLVLGEIPQMATKGYMGEELILGEEDLRLERNRQVLALPEAVALALPGEIGRLLPDAWSGHFRSGRLSSNAAARLEKALSRGESPEDVMKEVASSGEGEAVLFQWISDMHVTALCTEEAPRTTTEAAGRLVFVDDATEPVLIEATVGIALVTRSGDVVFRYDDTVETILSDATPLHAASRELARTVADEVRGVLLADEEILRDQEAW